jgi:hypothetical protein
MSTTSKKSQEARRSYEELPPPPATIDDDQRFELAEVFSVLRVSPATGFKKIKAGDIKTFKDGRRTYVMGSELKRASRPPDQQSAA